MRAAQAGHRHEQTALVITGRIKLLRLGQTGSRTHFGIESQRDHVKGSLISSLALHGIDPIGFELPAAAHFEPGETWETNTTDRRDRPIHIACSVTRSWARRTILRFRITIG